MQNPNPSVKPLVYLDSTATTQKPTSVIDKEAEYYLKTNANVHRGLYSLAEKATMEYEDARNIIADFIHALPEETIFTSGTTGSLNLAAMLLSPYLREGDEIVVTIMEHRSNFLPWQQLAQRKKCLLKIIPLTSEFSLDLNAAKAIITAKTKILACSYVSNVLGVVNPVKELIQLAKKNNAYTIIDAAQAIPHFKIDVQELGCDFLAFSGHKMLGPTGIGILYGRKSLLTQVEPVIFGGEMVKEASLQKISWNDLPWKFEAGTPNIAGAIALGRAVEYLQSLPSDIHEHLHQLTDYAIKRMENIPSLKIIGPTKSTIPRI
ncbi:aminotransferase class V-fold PLP-dependent enzyme, partial [Candidatus Woesearchaeota archaeon]|nr:aminotransferase class V-fold PLP-dependent enzyme [Candidatus Woesearchaeota archaeon]